MRRLALSAVFGLAFATMWAGALATPASAHAALKETDPANGALLDAPPKEIRFAFTEPPDLSLTTIGVVDRSGALVPTDPAEPVPRADRQIRVRLEDVPDGVYTVTWRTVSTVDGHVTSGAFTFGVGVAPGEVVATPQGNEAESSAPSALAVAGRWGLYVGVAVLFGGAITGLVVFGSRSLARPWLLASAWALAGVGVVAMTLGERADVGVPLGILLRSDSGGAFVRLAIAIGVLGLAAMLAAFRPARSTLLLLAVSAGAVFLVRAESGHAGPSTVDVLLQGMHLAAGGAWIGGLAWLIAGLRRGTDADRVRTYSNLAGIGLAVLVLTGILRASDELGGPTWWLHAFDTDYGTALVAKLAIVVPLVGFGALNRFRNVRRIGELGSRPLLRTVSGELVLAAGVFAMTGLLTGLPPQGVRAEPTPQRPESLVVSGSDFATTTTVRLQISPGIVGANAFVADVTDFDTGDTLDADRVTLTFALTDRPEVSSELELDRGEDGMWQADGTALSVRGTWAVTVLVEEGSGSVEVPLEVTPKIAGQRVEVTRVGGQPDIYTIHLEGGVSIQAYVDPGRPARINQVHITAFDATGAELPLHHVALTITPSDGVLFRPKLMQLSPGHFVANVRIDPGKSSFD
ncbi:MAG: copper resistance protein CopC, partial [Actinomycetota bacterium]|nr:copper resistance protein CopC [Actinomycetota bacterium]